jgi:hypothetical protein
MQLKTVNELGITDLIAQGYGDHYTVFDDDCGLCGEDVAGTVSSVPAVAIIDGRPQTEICSVYTDALGVIRVANTEEFSRCFT